MTNMAEFENAIRVRLKTPDGQQMLPQTSADLVVGLAESVRDTVITEGVHIETTPSGTPSSVKVVPADGITVVTGLERDDYGHVIAYTLGEFSVKSPDTVVVKENDTVLLKNAGSESGVRIEGRGIVKVDVEDSVLVIQAEAPKVKLYSNETERGWLSYTADDSIRPGIIYEEL